MGDSPLKWGDLVGHERTIRALRRAVTEGRPHPAYLFLGPEGIGKRSLARVFSRALACHTETDPPCGHCPACTKEEAGTLADVWHEVPQGKFIKVAQIAELQRRLSFRRLEARRRVVVFENASAMNTSAQNKLLKTLEEPPEDTVLLLTAVHRGQLLQTVRSRCQKLHLGPVAPETLIPWLESQGIDRAAAQVAAGAARGIPGEARILTDPELAEERSQRLRELLQALSGADTERDQFVGRMGRDRNACEEILDLLEELARDTIAWRLGAEVQRIHGDAEPEQSPLGQLPARRLAEFSDQVQAGRAKLHRNVDPAGVLSCVLARIPGGQP